MDLKFKPLLLSVIAGLLLSASWFWHFTILIFFAFIPLLVLEDTYSKKTGSSRLQFFGLSYLTFFLWNILVTWWIVYASFGGAAMAILCNSLLMTAVFLLFSTIKKRINSPYAIWILIPFWIAWEHIHTLWDITWPWLTIGNVFAFSHRWIQWYEFTGTSGGTLWALCANIVVFLVIKNNTAKRFRSASIYRIAAIIIAPILISYSLFFARTFMTNASKEVVPVVVVQPNIDPYNEKFSVGYTAQFHKMLNLVRAHLDEHTRYLVLPETFITGITEELNEDNINHYLEIDWFRDSIISKYPDLRVVTGGNTYRFYQKEQDVTSTARKEKRSGLYYDVYNTAIYIDPFNTDVYHKSKLVPGVERMPFPALLKPLEGLAINMGGTMGSLGTQQERSVFKNNKTGIAVAPVICYESVYADYVAEYIRLGASFIFIITNDGWWQDTPGYLQHLNYARLRAIENRREIARSANTGISCFIDAYGNISEATPWWKEAVIKKNMNASHSLTFFSRFGDLLSYLSVTVSALLILWSFYLRFRTN